ncbi:MAG: hypothetical protein R3B70_24340 [Polyangiaceae bacterium]
MTEEQEHQPSALRKNIPLLTVLFCQVLLAALAILLKLVTVPAFVEAFESHDGRFSLTTRLAFTSWLLPATVALPIAFDILALTRRKKSARNFLLGLGLIVPTIGLVIAVDGLFVPLFRGMP